MDMNEIHDYARRLLAAHGDQAEQEAARKAAECEQGGDKTQGCHQHHARAACELTAGLPARPPR
jgi:hypothetical protein